MGLIITTMRCPRPDCGGNIVLDDDGREYCLLCSRPDEVNKRQDAGRIGGIQTSLRYGTAHMIDIGRRGGRPKARTLIKQQSACEVSIENERKARLPNDLKGLKTLWKERRGESLVADGSPQGGVG